jgi:hypothetical protein
MSVRTDVLDHLATPHAERRHADPYLPAAIRARSGCRPHEVWETLWGLVGEGLVYLDPAGQARASSQDNWEWRLSTVGVQAAAGGSWEPRDQDGYLRRLRREVRHLDPIVDQYAEEALRAFNARCYLAASVMLGVASERAFLNLANAVAVALGPDATKLTATLANPRASQHTKFVEFRKVVEPRRAQLPHDLADTLTLDAVGELLRITRNEAGHPTGASIDEDAARTHLLIAGGYLKKMARLQEHFAASAEDASTGTT